MLQVLDLHMGDDRLQREPHHTPVLSEGAAVTVS